MATATPADRSLELFVRSLSPTEAPATDHVDRVRTFAADGRVADATVTVWGDEVGLAETPRRTATGRFILERVAALRAWAADNDVGVAPFFRTREVATTVTGETFTAMRLPVCCLAEYRDCEVVHVTPHLADDRTVTVADRLQQLERAAGATASPAHP